MYILAEHASYGRERHEESTVVQQACRKQIPSVCLDATTKINETLPNLLDLAVPYSSPP